MASLRCFVSYVLPCIGISFLCSFNDKVVAEIDFKNAELKLAREEQYVLRSMKSRKNLFVQKCCLRNEFLNKDGSCVNNTEVANEHQINSGTLLKQEISKLIQHEGDGDLEFRLNENHPKCQAGNLKRLSYPLNSTPQSIYLTLGLQLVIEKELFGNESSLVVDPSNFCVDWESLHTVVILYCVHDTCQTIPGEIGSSSVESLEIENRILPNVHNISSKSSSSSSSRSLCLRKCCPPSQAINMTDFTCVRYDIPWHLSSSLKPSHSAGEREENSGNGKQGTSGLDDANEILPVSWITGVPNCVSSYEVYADQYDRYYINSDGLLITEGNGNVARTPPGEYCFDAVVRNEEEEGIYSKNLKESHFSPLDPTAANDDDDDDDNAALQFYNQMALVCFGKQKEEAKFDWRNVYTILTGVSSLFLFVTCLVYVILWKDLNLPGWLQFAYAFSLFVTFALLSVAQIWSQRIHNISKNLCRSLGYGLHFTFLTCFFYLTSMNLDLWLSFRSNAMVRGFGKSRGKRRFFEFSTFSIGFPALVTILLLAADSCSSSKGSPHEYGSSCFLPNSGIGETSCVIDIGHKVAQLHYFYGFVGVLLLINLVIFVATLISLRNRERETRMAKQQSTSCADYDRLQLFTRLFLIMGILWIFEVISWTFEFFEVDGGIKSLFIFTDCLNASQGIAVFLMFVWKRQTWKQLKKKFKSRFGIRGKRPLFRPSYNCTVSSGGNTATNGTSTKSTHLSSTKSTDSSRLPSTSTFTQLELEGEECLSEEK